MNDELAATKARWRAQLSAARGSLSAQQQVSEAAALIEAVRGTDFATPGNTVACYVPFGSEPGSIGLLDALCAAGARVILPVVPPQPGPLDWSEYTGTASLRTGELRGVLEPAGARLGVHTIAEAAFVLVPALAADHRGVRLGRGAGYYDRSLALAAPESELTAIVRESEFVRELPAEAHDIRLTSVLTPSRGKVRLPLPGADAASV